MGLWGVDVVNHVAVNEERGGYRRCHRFCAPFQMDRLVIAG
ncbi:hypothetical protein L841_3219 [Mycobacterium sp. MAC_080597_8934]|nr:hypothetical protein L841_3219 [Mycobacterium sp. MAC_080597_8934]ETZ75024.1 hypothetical protein L840_1315 [Mycobacterium sp. MAC_011194_8550]